jgi:hypothetical protein
VTARTAPPALERVPTPAERGWLTSQEARALLLTTYGASVATRTIQGWTRDVKHPLRHVRMGHRLLLWRDDLLRRIGAAPDDPGEGAAVRE